MANGNNFVLVIIAGVAVWVLSREQDGGTGVDPGRRISDEQPEVMGPVTVGGGLGVAQVSQDGRFVPMGTHLVQKVPGEEIAVSVPWIADTRAAGNPINWPYLLQIRMGHNTVFGWKIIADLPVDEPGPRQPNFVRDGHRALFVVESVGTPGTHVAQAFFRMPEDRDGQEWDIHITLEGALPDPNTGRPTSTFMRPFLAGPNGLNPEGEHNRAIQTALPEVGVAGTLGLITVSRGMMARARAHKRKGLEKVI